MKKMSLFNKTLIKSAIQHIFSSDLASICNYDRRKNNLIKNSLPGGHTAQNKKPK